MIKLLCILSSAGCWMLAYRAFTMQRWFFMGALAAGALSWLYLLGLNFSKPKTK